MRQQLLLTLWLSLGLYGSLAAADLTLTNNITQSEVHGVYDSINIDGVHVQEPSGALEVRGGTVKLYPGTKVDVGASLKIYSQRPIALRIEPQSLPSQIYYSDSVTYTVEYGYIENGNFVASSANHDAINFSLKEFMLTTEVASHNFTLPANQASMTINVDDTYIPSGIHIGTDTLLGTSDYSVVLAWVEMSDSRQSASSAIQILDTQIPTFHLKAEARIPYQGGYSWIPLQNDSAVESKGAVNRFYISEPNTNTDLLRFAFGVDQYSLTSSAQLSGTISIDVAVAGDNVDLLGNLTQDISVVTTPAGLSYSYLTFEIDGDSVAELHNNITFEITNIDTAGAAIGLMNNGHDRIELEVVDDDLDISATNVAMSLPSLTVNNLGNYVVAEPTAAQTSHYYDIAIDLTGFPVFTDLSSTAEVLLSVRKRETNIITPANPPDPQADLIAAYADSEAYIRTSTTASTYTLWPADDPTDDNLSDKNYILISVPYLELATHLTNNPGQDFIIEDGLRIDHNSSEQGEVLDTFYLEFIRVHDPAINGYYYTLYRTPYVAGPDVNDYVNIEIQEVPSAKLSLRVDGDELIGNNETTYDETVSIEMVLGRNIDDGLGGTIWLEGSAVTSTNFDLNLTHASLPGGWQNFWSGTWSDTVNNIADLQTLVDFSQVNASTGKAPTIQDALLVVSSPTDEFDSGTLTFTTLEKLVSVPTDSMSFDAQAYEEALSYKLINYTAHPESSAPPLLANGSRYIIPDSQATTVNLDVRVVPNSYIYVHCKGPSRLQGPGIELIENIYQTNASTTLSIPIVLYDGQTEVIVASPQHRGQVRFVIDREN